MKKLKCILKSVFFVLVSLVINEQIKSQVSSVNYWIKYNADSSWYDCYVIMNDGQTTNNNQRLLSNCQYTIVTLAGDSVEVVKSYEPKQSIGGTAPITWENSTIIRHPEAQPQNDFLGIYPSKPGYFPVGTKGGDTIKLFSLKSYKKSSTFCGNVIRNYENGVDPGSIAPGMQGNDFSNGFFMGSFSQMYKGNSKKEISGHKIIIVNGSITSDILTDKYHWYDCNSNELITTTSISEFKPESSGSYFCAIDKGDCLLISNCIDIIISNSEEITNHDFFIYPNPVSDELYIVSSTTIKTLELFDMNGSLVLKKVNGEQKIAMQDLPSGMYVLKLDEGGYIKIVKL